jgi:hypothetical protein
MYIVGFYSAQKMYDPAFQSSSCSGNLLCHLYPCMSFSSLDGVSAVFISCANPAYPLLTMSLLIEGRQTHPVSYSGAARTLISPAFAGTLSRPPPGPFLVTVSAGISGPCPLCLNTLLSPRAWPMILFLVSIGVLSFGIPSSPLGLEFLILPDTFDAWAFYSSRLIISLLPTLIRQGI